MPRPEVGTSLGRLLTNRLRTLEPCKLGGQRDTTNLLINLAEITQISGVQAIRFSLLYWTLGLCDQMTFTRSVHQPRCGDGTWFGLVAERFGMDPGSSLCYIQVIGVMCTGSRPRP